MLRQRGSELIKTIPQDTLCFIGPQGHVGHQQSRQFQRKLPQSQSAFSLGNFHYVYKNPSQLKEEEISHLSNLLFQRSLYPDTIPDVSLAFCAIVHLPSDFICPICLFTPVSPVATRCGHVFCGDCLAAYLDSKENGGCPVCGEEYAGTDILLASLVFHTEGVPVCFQRVRRYGYETLVLPSGAPKVLPTVSNPTALLSPFSIADKTFVENYRMETLENLDVQTQIYAEYDSESKLQYIADRRRRIERIVIPEDTDIQFTLGSSEEFVEFYQAADGRHIYLDQFVIRTLIEEFGSLDKAPEILELPIAKSRPETVTDKNRHSRVEFETLPYGSEVQIALIDISPILTRRQKHFKATFDARTRQKKQSPPKNRVITQEDFVRFDPLEPEEEPQMNDKDEFPSLSATPPPPKRPKRSPWDSFTS